MKIPRIEMETTILYDESSPIANVYTCNKSLINKLDKLVLNNSDIYRIYEDEYSKKYLFPKSWIRISLPRQLSDKRRQELSELIKLRNKNIDKGAKNETTKKKTHENRARNNNII